MFPDASVPPNRPETDLPLDFDDLPNDDQTKFDSFQPLDAIRFLLSFFTISQLCPTTFSRFKERVFSIPQLCEDLLKTDAFFKAKVSALYAYVLVNDGIDLCAYLFEFRSSVLDTLSPNSELADLMLFYVIYRNSIHTGQQTFLNYINAMQEFTEILYRTSNQNLKSFFRTDHAGQV